MLLMGVLFRMKAKHKDLGSCLKCLRLRESSTRISFSPHQQSVRIEMVLAEKETTGDKFKEIIWDISLFDCYNKFLFSDKLLKSCKIFYPWKKRIAMLLKYLYQTILKNWSCVPMALHSNITIKAWVQWTLSEKPYLSAF